MYVVLLNRGLRITFSSHRCAAVYTRDPLCPLILVIRARLRLARPGGGGEDSQGEEEQWLCLQGSSKDSTVTAAVCVILQWSEWWHRAPLLLSLPIPAWSRGYAGTGQLPCYKEEKFIGVKHGLENYFC